MLIIVLLTGSTLLKILTLPIDLLKLELSSSSPCEVQDHV
ncbi:hypothetical protein J2736_003620 [Paenibacillus qinlingensis]|uniref:Uncharacterized protein n=1 Tax=Paenibacillus qinlingensis TaxID=1837343 RepID=A0ABU1NY28_9BACL|nr:hypothetical protein [Paenibacillus qinlingensis]